MKNATKTAAAAPQTKKPIKKRTMAQETWRRFKKNKGAMVGAGFLCILILIAIFAPIIIDWDTQIVAMNMRERLQTPSLAHPFGTDYMGRDIFLRILYGTRYSLIIGVCSIAIACSAGFVLGCIAGFKGGWVENIIMRLGDIIRGVPGTLLCIALCAALGQGMTNMILACGLGGIVTFMTYTRASVLSVRGNEYIEAAKAIGATDWQIITKHVMPNAMSPIIVQISMRIGGTIITAAGMSFLGLGIPLPTPEWGAMLSEGRQYIRNSPWMTLFPGLAILVTVISFNLMGDGLRDALDPKLKT